MSRHIPRLAVPSVLAALIGAPAFAAPPPSQPQPRETPVQQPQQAPPQQQQPQQKQEGAHATALVDKVLRDVPLSPHQQTAVARLKQDERAAYPPVDKSEKAFFEALGEQMKNGKIDRPQLDGKLSALADAMVKWRETENTALDKLHRYLDRSQRAVVAPRIEAMSIDRLEKPPDLGHLTKELGLSQGQRKDMAQVLRAMVVDQPAAPARSAARAKEVVDTFKADDDIKVETFRPASEARSASLASSEQQVDFARRVIPVLTPDQRDKLAEQLKKNGAF